MANLNRQEAALGSAAAGTAMDSYQKLMDRIAVLTLKEDRVYNVAVKHERGAPRHSQARLTRQAPAQTELRPTCAGASLVRTPLRRRHNPRATTATREKPPSLVEYVNEPSVDRKPDDRSRPKAANSGHRGGDVRPGLQIGEDDRFGAQHFGSSDGSDNGTAFGEREMLGPDAHHAICVKRVFSPHLKWHR
jgi:hypothetical protein